ncbi:hypothetical protein CISIN_1g0448941mg, partial [Citrus sinensis]
MGPHCR